MSKGITCNFSKLSAQIPMINPNKLKEIEVKRRKESSQTDVQF